MELNYGKPWSQEEIDFIKRSYSISSTDEIAEAIGRTTKSVRSMARRLGIKKQKEEFEPGMKRCSICKKVMPYDQFYKNKRNLDGRTSSCKICRSEQQTENRKIIKMQQDTEHIIYTCSSCHKEKEGWHFKWDYRSNKRATTCKTCCVEKDKISKVKRIKEGRDW